MSAPVTTAMPAPAAGSPVRAEAKVRDPWFDNAKMALVTLVVVGHAWTLLPGSAFHAHVYDFLYAWHVPAFVLVTGYLSRSFAWTRARFWQLFCTVVVPYLLFESAMSRSASTSAASTSRTCSPTPTGRCGTSRHSSSGGC